MIFALFVFAISNSYRNIDVAASEACKIAAFRKSDEQKSKKKYSLIFSALSKRLLSPTHVCRHRRRILGMWSVLCIVSHSPMWFLEYHRYNVLHTHCKMKTISTNELKANSIDYQIRYLFYSFYKLLLLICHWLMRYLIEWRK